MHRALPLDLIESRTRAARVAWADHKAAAVIHKRFPNCNGACEAGRSACTCPSEAGSACSEFLEDQTESADRQVAGWIVKAAAVLFLVLFCVWVIAGGADPYIARIVEAMNAP